MIRKTHLRLASAILLGCAALALVGCVPSGYVRDYPQYRSYPNSGYIGGYSPNSGYSGSYHPYSGYPSSGYSGSYYPGSSYYGRYYGSYYPNRYYFDGYYPGRYYGFVPRGYYWNGLFPSPYPYRPRHPQQGHDDQDGDHGGQGSGGQGSGGEGSGPGRPRQGGHLPVRDVEPGLAGTSPKAPYIRNPDIKRQQANPVADKARAERPTRANRSQSYPREVRNTREARSDTREMTLPNGRSLPPGVAKP